MVTSGTDTVKAWERYLEAAADWQKLVEGVEPKDTDCGPVYELPSPLNRPRESFAIADMRSIRVADPHYHKEETEIYFVLEGTGTIVVGGKEIEVKKGSVVITPPNTAHFTIPHGLVLAVVNTPPFSPGNYVPLTDSDSKVGFDKEQFTRLST